MFFELTLFIGFEFELFWNLKNRTRTFKTFHSVSACQLSNQTFLKKKSSFADIHYHPQPGYNHNDN